jgi:uncharacterized protein (DUF2126 family)/transglutaminase-like putative cysteine protease
MSIRVAIEHRTVYRYDRPVHLGPQVMRLRPAPHCRTPILAYSLRVTPEQHFLNWQQDPIGNYQARFVFPEPTSEFSVTVDLVAELTPLNPFDFFIDEGASQWPFSYDQRLARDLAPYLQVEAPAADAVLDGWMATLRKAQPPDTTIDFLVWCNQRVRETVAYSVRMEAGVQTPEQTLSRQIGSCRDSAWLLVNVLRRFGIAARFVSGYLVQLAQDKPAAGDQGENVDFTDLHAWAEAFVPGAGWIGLDATSGLVAGEGHIPLACAAEPSGAAPVEGLLTAAGTSFEYSNTVVRLDQPARVTLPYNPEQWSEIDRLGEQVDQVLEDADVRLTMGGEPTFVSAEHAEEPEWTVAALGGVKEELATKLTEALAQRFSPGALVLYGQGKWYPGEPLPRWQRGVYWRTDGHPLWHDRELLADPGHEGTATAQQAKQLVDAIADGLGFPAEVRYPAYEDPFPQSWRESLRPGDEPVPEGLDPLAELGEQREPTGWALPLRRDPGEGSWSTGLWHLRRGALYLVEGDSPMGLRLPLSSLTWRPEPQHPDQSLFRQVQALTESLAGGPAAATVSEPPPITALCVQVRGGHVHVFLPPLLELAYAAELLAVIERALVKTGLRAVIEGYPPPRDVRGASFVITPDPGVIEINIHPSASWRELVERTEHLYAESELLGLRADKFALDGSHTGTGGGSHITLGGTTPADSPMLRNPALLSSMLTYWQHHPSLSYLFAGRFIGPTSQAPRVDEARHENLYELEIAFAELERTARECGGVTPAWQVDRALRNLLTDLTGNTHRAEFCIDKLFNPDAENGRLGVLELRSFEMAPHPQMALVQLLLVRALVARLWQEPYGAPLIRWGTELQDRFMLPWWIESDIGEVLGDLGRHGFEFDPQWLAPFLEFRFPLIGRLSVEGVNIELRSALEPWNVLGEEAGSGTSRYVDSSLARLQLRLDGLTEDRYAVTCNGYPIPLQATETPGTFVGGVRYRAWALTSALHPTIPVHAPLTFDLVDLWSSRSLGGCRYHVVHPGGRSYERLPVNAAEAEARRSGRFEALGHTPGKIALEQIRHGGEYPRTLDLRRRP